MSHNSGWGRPHPGYPGQPVPPWGGWAPPAPQPGVIPLRPLRTGEVLGGAFTAFRRHWKPLTGVVLLVQGVGILLVAAAIGLAAIGVRSEFAAVFDLPAGETPAAGDVASLLLWLAPVVVLFTVTMLLLTAMIGALCPAVIQEAVLGRPVTFSALWRRCWSRLPAVLGVVLCVGLLTGAPLLLLYAACVLPALTAVAQDTVPPVGLFLLPIGMLLWMPFAVWLTVRFSLAPAVAVCEGLGPIAAMRRSSRLVEGAWWRTFGVGALAYLLAAVVGYVIQLPFTFIGFFALIPAITATGDAAQPATLVFGFMGYMACVLLGAVIGSVLQLGYSQLVLALLYVDQRMRKENLAQALIASAPDSAAPAPPGA